MPTQDALLIDQIRTVKGDGQSDFITHDAVIRPGRSSFTSQDDLNAYLVKVLGAKLQNGGVVGSLSHKGKYVRRSADGTDAVTFGDPLLDSISSATGTVVVGGRTIDLKPLRPGPNTPAQPGSGGVIFDAPALKFMGIVHDAEQWVSEDGSYVEYRIRNGRLGFQAWRRGPSIQDLGAWEMGVQVSVWNTPMKY